MSSPTHPGSCSEASPGPPSVASPQRRRFEGSALAAVGAVVSPLQRRDGDRDDRAPSSCAGGCHARGHVPGVALESGPARGYGPVCPAEASPFHNDISGVTYCEERLREIFDTLDTNRNGYLERDEFRAFTDSIETYGAAGPEEFISSILQQYGMLDDGKVTYDEFALIMTRLAAR